MNVEFVLGILLYLFVIIIFKLEIYLIQPGLYRQ